MRCVIGLVFDTKSLGIDMSVSLIKSKVILIDGTHAISNELINSALTK